MAFQGRDKFSIASGVHPDFNWMYLRSLPLGSNKSISVSRPSVQDRRFWHPLGRNRPALFVNGNVSPVTEIDPDVWRRIHRPLKPLVLPRPNRLTEFKRAVAFSGKFGFMQALKTAICVKRSQRREIFHALRKAGKIGQRKPKFDAFSFVRC